MLNPLDAKLLGVLHHLVEHSSGYSPENRAAAHADIDEHFGVEPAPPEPEPAADAEQGPAEPDPRDAEIAELKAQLAAATEGK